MTSQAFINKAGLKHLFRVFESFQIFEMSVWAVKVKHLNKVRDKSQAVGNIVIMRLYNGR